MYQAIKRFLLEKILCHGLVLDVGCGSGSFQRRRHIIGLDVDKENLKRCPYPFKVLGDVQHLPFRNKSVDVTLEMGCLPYVKDWRKALSEMKRVGEKVFLIEPIRRRFRSHWFSLLDLIKLGRPVFFISRTVVIKVAT